MPVRDARDREQTAVQHGDSRAPICRSALAEHSHIPVNRRFTLPGTMELSKQYYDVMDPFVTLTAAAT